MWHDGFQVLMFETPQTIALEALGAICCFMHSLAFQSSKHRVWGCLAIQLKYLTNQMDVVAKHDVHFDYHSLSHQRCQNAFAHLQSPILPTYFLTWQQRKRTFPETKFLPKPSKAFSISDVGLSVTNLPVAQSNDHHRLLSFKWIFRSERKRVLAR